MKTYDVDSLYKADAIPQIGFYSLIEFHFRLFFQTFLKITLSLFISSAAVFCEKQAAYKKDIA